MVKKAILGVSAAIFSIMVAGLVVQMSDASEEKSNEVAALAESDSSGETIPTGTPSGTIPTKTPVIGETLPTRTPDPGTVPTRTPDPAGGCIQFAHFIDYEAGSAPLYVEVNNFEVAELTYGKITECINVPPGSSTIKVVALDSSRAPEDTLLAFASFSVNSGGNYTAVLQGNSGTTEDDTITFVTNQTAAPSSGKAKVRVVHAAPFSATSSTVDLKINNTNNVVGSAGSLNFGDVTSYFEVDADVFHNWYFSPNGSSSSILELAPKKFFNGEVVTLYFTGGTQNRGLEAVVDTSLESSFLPVIFIDSSGR